MTFKHTVLKSHIRQLSGIQNYYFLFLILIFFFKIITYYKNKNNFHCSSLLILNNGRKLSTISQTLTKAIYSANKKFPFCVTSLLLLSPCLVPTRSLCYHNILSYIKHCQWYCHLKTDPTCL